MLQCLAWLPALSLFRSLLLVIAGSTQRELARQVRYLKVEHEILRSKLPIRITITSKERRRLVKYGSKLGKALHRLVTIVTPGTFLRWIREDKRAGRKRTKPAKRDRLRTAEEIRRLVVKLAKENAWGYARIVGELKKLGLRSMKKSTVRNILKAEGLDPCPKWSGATWDEFLVRHAASLWQCDFFTQKVLTVKGLREVFVLAFLNVKTRRVVLTPATFNPNEAWVVQQSEAFVERFIGSIRRECLDHFVIFGADHLDSVARVWIEHCHAERPHQGRENEVLVRPPGTKKLKVADATAFSLREDRCRKRLGGLLKHYERIAA